VDDLTRLARSIARAGSDDAAVAAAVRALRADLPSSVVADALACHVGRAS